MAKRQIPCPFCNNEKDPSALSEQNGQAARSASLWPKLQNIVFAITDILNLLLGEAISVDRLEAMGGKCEACDNKRTIDDPSDSTDADKAAEGVLKANEQKLVDNLAKLGSSPGGSRLTRIAGADVLLVGHVLNKAESVGIMKNVAGPGGGPAIGKSSSGEGNAVVRTGNKGHTAVKHLNPPSNSGGGHYVIQCGNKFDLITGAQGANINTYGVLNLHGKGGVQITGSEVTLGSSEGQVAIGGKNINIQAENSLTLASSNGKVNIACNTQTDNLVAGGAFFDNLFFVKATCPSKQVPVKGGSTSAVSTGAATWGGPNTFAQRAALLQLFKHTQERITDFDLFKAGGPVTPRFIFNLKDLMYNVGNAALPIENKPTGICVVDLGILGKYLGTVFNFPHQHVMHDGLHTHQVEVPAINYTGNTSANAVRKAANAGGINEKISATTGNDGNILEQLWDSLGNLWNALGAIFTTQSDHGTMAG